MFVCIINLKRKFMMKKTIDFDANVLNGFFKQDFKALRIYYRKEESGSGSVFRSEALVVADFVKYAQGTNNWCTEDLELFEQELLDSNPTYQDFKSFLIKNDYWRFTPIELGTLWVVRCAMFTELLDMGFADLNNSAAANSWVEAVKKYERTEKRRTRAKGIEVENEGGGRKNNVYNTSYMKWIHRLLPWLKKHPSIGNQKEGLIFIGILLEAAGHLEFKEQYAKDCRETIVERKVKSKSRFVEFETVIEQVQIPYREYLHNRLKTIMTRLQKRKLEW